MRGFGSDNHAGVHPRIMAALARANVDHAPSYGTDDWTRRADQVMRTHFGAQAHAYFVFNGTAANVLSLHAMARPHESVICGVTSHLHNDECGAPEGVGARKLVVVPTDHGKIAWSSVEPVLVRGGDQHFAQPKVLSITNPTEYGTVYSPHETRTLCEAAHARGLLVHVDGARLVNAAAALGCSLAELTSDAGVDVLSLGGTKNGLLFGEAVVFLRGGLDEYFKYSRKQMMQLPSKTRFIAAQFCEWLGTDLWRDIAEHANQMARHLAAGLEEIERVPITQPVQANVVFARLPRDWIAPLREHAFFYVWDERTFECRLMTSFDTTPGDVDTFLDAVRRLSSKLGM